MNKAWISWTYFFHEYAPNRSWRPLNTQLLLEMSIRIQWKTSRTPHKNREKYIKRSYLGRILWQIYSLHDMPSNVCAQAQTVLSRTLESSGACGTNFGYPLYCFYNFQYVLQHQPHQESITGSHANSRTPYRRQKSKYKWIGILILIL